MELIILLLFSSRYLPKGWISCTLENLYGMKKWSAKTLYILVIPAKIWGVFSLRADFPLCRHERVSRFVLCECGRWLSSGSLAMIVVGSVRWAADRLRATMLAHIKIDSERLISHCFGTLLSPLSVFYFKLLEEFDVYLRHTKFVEIDQGLFTRDDHWSIGCDGQSSVLIVVSF